jgi:hypothetical protein
MPAGSFAICRTEKIKAWSTLTKSVGHNLRTSADQRPHLSRQTKEGLRVLAGDPNWVASWKEQVQGMHLRQLKQGTQHTLAREFFLGVSPDHFKNRSKEERDSWAQANVDWLNDRFGKERVKLVVLHLDEQTEHIAAYVVPLKADVNRKGEPSQRGNGWTLSDASLGLSGSKDALSKLQTEYASAMRRFELNRGLKGSKRTHQSTATWAKQMAQPLDQPILLPKTIEPTIADRINIEDYGKRATKAGAESIYRQMKPYRQQARAQSTELALLRKETSTLKPLADAFKRLVELLLGHAPDLGSLEGLKRVEEALKSFTKEVKSGPEHVVELAIPRHINTTKLASVDSLKRLRPFR